MDEKFNLKMYLAENKGKHLAQHQEFFRIIDNIKSYQDITRRMVEKSDTFVKDEDNLFKSVNMNAILVFIMAEKVTSVFDNFGDMFSGDKEKDKPINL